MVSQVNVDWIAVDWGTSNLRVWAMGASDQVVGSIQSDKGMGGLAPSDFEPTLISLVEAWLGGDTTPVVACGMVGARQGWAEAQYLPVPTKPAGDQIMRVSTKDTRIEMHILAGVSQTNPPDVMRGEETQIAGLLHMEPNFRGITCLPGTHTKWVQIVDGEIFHFATFMTGELFALVTKNSVLRHSVDGDGDGWDDRAFFVALDDALTTPERVANRLFSLRASGLLLGTGTAESRATLSGLLIGLELGGARPYWLGQDVAIIGDGGLVSVYAKALEHAGLAPRCLKATDMVLRGLCTANKILKGKANA